MADDFSTLLDNDTHRFPKVGDLIEGMVISYSNNEALLDIDGIATGIIRGPELFDESGEFEDLKPGEKAAATVLELENEKGLMELSFRHAGHLKAWDRLKELHKNGEVVDAQITEANKGGVIVRVGRVSGFLPVSQLIPEHYPRVEGGDKNKILERLQGYIGQSFKVKVIDVDEIEDKLIVSEKAAWEERQKDVLESYKVGNEVDGTVTGVVDFGAFVEFGEGLEGLVHISELAWQRIDNPRDVIKVGDNVKTVIIALEGSKISLSMKRLMDDPWKKASSKYEVGQMVKGKVIKTNPFGAFVELDPDIHGLAHISELSDKLVRDPSDIVKIGEEYAFYIISIEPDKHRLGLSLKKKKKDDVEEPVEDEVVNDKPQEEKQEEPKAEPKEEVPAEQEVVVEPEPATAPKSDEPDEPKV